MILFGPAIVKFDGAILGETSGGVQIKLLYVEVHPVGGARERIAYGGEGVLHMFSWDKEITLSRSLTLEAPARLELVSDWYTITIYRAKLHFPQTLNVGTLEHTPFDVAFTFDRGSEGLLTVA